MNLMAFFNNWAVIFLFLFGLFAMITARNLFRKIIGMSILQTSVILFYVSLAAKHEAHIPIIHHVSGHTPIDLTHLANPLPHALMLTAIVVGVSTLGVALVLAVSIYQNYQSLEEPEILNKTKEAHHG